MPADASSGLTLAGIGDEAGHGIDAQLAAVRSLGWTAIELRGVDGIPLAELTEPAFARVTDAVRAAGLSVVAVDSRIGGWARPADGDFTADVDELRTLGRRCPVLGTRYVRIMSYPSGALAEPAWRATVIERIRVLTHHAEQAGLVLLHENCAGWAGSSASRVHDLLQSVDSPALGLLFDIGNGIAHGYSAYELLRETAGHVRHVHVKDADGPAADPVYRLPGRGQSRVADCLRLLLDSGYAGALSIEPHLAVVPHEGRRAPDAECSAAFAASGRALAELLGELTAERRDPAAVGSGRTR
ncbi:sugar phosphate isomerase/epimerase family protein [Streptomyces sp. NPDC014889]|uniref:sugar phosphate isomerase/epimerase family protein n=1 Tax=Streptomyces sp. NPDC014889 TaxID=3364928 RepID=UPI0036FAFC43